MPPSRLSRAKKLFEGRDALGAVVVAALLFLALGILVRYSVLNALDLRVTRELQRGDWPPLGALMVACTQAGSPAVVPVVALLAAAALWRARLPRAAKLVLLSLLAVPIDVVLKGFWDRARPDKGMVHVAVDTSGTSFPSGHALWGTALYGALAVLAWIHIDRRRGRLPVVLLLVALTLGVDVSRVYLGAHWLSDVVGGAAFGLLILIPLVRWYLRGVKEEATKKDAAPSLP